MKEGEKYFEGRVSLKAIIVSPTGKVLICRNLKDEVLWDLPGGTLNYGEKPEEGLRREIQEELGIEPKIEVPLKADIFIKPATGKEVFVLTYIATFSDEPSTFTLDATELAEAKWITAKDLQTLHLFPEYHRQLELFFKLRDN